jgi:hypothetical protein
MKFKSKVVGRAKIDEKLYVKYNEEFKVTTKRYRESTTLKELVQRRQIILLSRRDEV